MRRTCDDIWVIDCSPEGHQPEVNTRIFQGVQQPVCIVMASRSKATKADIPANIHFQSLPLGKREVKFDALLKLNLNDQNWVIGPTGWRAPFFACFTRAMGRVSGDRRVVHLQRLWGNARQNLDYCA